VGPATGHPKGVQGRSHTYRIYRPYRIHRPCPALSYPVSVFCHLNRTIRVAVIVVVLMLMPPAPVQASDDGVLRVHVVHAPGVAVPVRLVVARSPNGADPREVVLEGGASPALINGLSPGTYDVSLEVSGAAATTESVSISAARVTVLVVRLAPAGGAPSIQRRDAFRIGEGADFDVRSIRDLPSAHDLWSLVETAAPFVIVDRVSTGGLGLGRSALMGSRGESWALTAVSFGGLQIRSPTRTGLLPVGPDMNAADAVTVTSGLAPVEVDTPGVRLGFVPKQPGSQWHGGFDASVTTPGMVGDNALSFAPSVARIEDWRDAGAFAGGPLTSFTGLFAAAAFSRAASLERDLSRLDTAERSSLFAHLVSQPSPLARIALLGAVERAVYPFDDRRQFSGTDVTERSTFTRGQLSWDRMTTRGSRRTVAVGFQRGAWRPDVPAGATGGTIDRAVDRVVPSPAADLVHSQFDLRAEWGSAVVRWGPVAHDLRAGVTLRRSGAAHDIVALPTVAERVAGLPARVWLPTAPTVGSSRTLSELGVYAADRVALGSSFTIDAGVRADLVRGSADGSGSRIRWATVSPRVSFRWSPAAIAVFGGVGRYAGGHPLSWLAFGDPGEATWNVSRWTDPNADGIYAPGEAGVLVARAGAGATVGSIDPDLRVPRTTEWVVGAEIRPTRHSTLRGSIIIRRQTDLVGVVNTGVPTSDYRLFFVPDINSDEGSPQDDQLLPIYERLPSSFGNDALLLTNPDADPVRHDGIEVTYQITSPRWFMVFGATAYRTLGRGGLLGHDVLENDQLVPGDRFSNPNATDDPAGRLFFDRAYVGKWTTAYRAPGDVRLAAVVRYQDGQPFTRYVVASDLAGGPEIVHAYPVGRTRFTYTATVDFRVEKGISRGSRRASVRLDVFNLTNHANELEEDVVSGPGFRLSTVVQPPRTLRLGVRFEF
jgi:hypothetical protein